jgi:hypothetical protein
MTTPEEMIECIETATQIAPRNGGLVLSEWEEDFIESIQNQLSDGRRLTPRQIEKLEEIWDKT